MVGILISLKEDFLTVINDYFPLFEN